MLAGRMDHLSVGQAPPAASEVSRAAKVAAAPKAKRAAAKKKPIVLSDSEDEEDESLPSSASEPDEASDSEDDFSPEAKSKAAPARRCVPSSPWLLAGVLSVVQGALRRACRGRDIYSQKVPDLGRSM